MPWTWTRCASGSTPAPYTYNSLYDVNGTGNINSIDVSAERGFDGTTLPGGNPAAAPPAAAAPPSNLPSVTSQYVYDEWGAAVGEKYTGRLGWPGSAQTYELVGGPRHGTAVVRGDGTFDYIPRYFAFEGPDPFTFKLVDATDPAHPVESHPASVVVETTRLPLWANGEVFGFYDRDGDGSMRTSADSNDPASDKSYNLLLNDFGKPVSDGNSAESETRVAAGGGPTSAGGNVTVEPSGYFTYTPPRPDFEGRDTFTYSFTDSRTARVSNAATGPRLRPVPRPRRQQPSLRHRRRRHGLHVEDQPRQGGRELVQRVAGAVHVVRTNQHRQLQRRRSDQGRRGNHAQWARPRRSGIHGK